MTYLVFNDVNAFTDRAMRATGNPAAICLVDHFPADQVMEQAAFRLKSPMTSFVRITDDPHIFEIRHFSPDGKENHVCGHATLAAAEVVARRNPDLRQGQTVTFKLNPKFAINAANAFTAQIKGRDIHLTVPAVTEMEEVQDKKFYTLLADALGLSEQDFTGPAYYVPRIINYVVGLKDQDTLIRMKPDFAKLKSLAASAEFPHEGIMATTQSQISGFDILTRVFLPIIDVDEDVACGSANCSVVPYWAMKRAGSFDAAKTTFRSLFPYPPTMHDNKVGGVQELTLHPDSAEITVKGQAKFQRTIAMNITPRPQAPAGPKP